MAGERPVNLLTNACRVVIESQHPTPLQRYLTYLRPPASDRRKIATFPSPVRMHAR
jgi:hypothetical protein